MIALRIDRNCGDFEKILSKVATALTHKFCNPEHLWFWECDRELFGSSCVPVNDFLHYKSSTEDACICMDFDEKHMFILTGTEVFMTPGSKINKVIEVTPPKSKYTIKIKYDDSISSRIEPLKEAWEKLYSSTTDVKGAWDKLIDSTKGKWVDE